MKKKLSLSPWCCLLAWVLLERAEMPLFCVLCAFACCRPPWVSFCPCRACFGVVAFLHACFIVYTENSSWVCEHSHIDFCQKIYYMFTLFLYSFLYSFLYTLSLGVRFGGVLYICCTSIVQNSCVLNIVGVHIQNYRTPKYVASPKYVVVLVAGCWWPGCL